MKGGREGRRKGGKEGGVFLSGRKKQRELFKIVRLKCYTAVFIFLKKKPVTALVSTKNVSPSRYNTKFSATETDMNSESLMIINKQHGRT